MPENVNTSSLAFDFENEVEQDDRPVMIKVDHVSMSFNMASERLNSLKEYAVSIMKGNLFFEEFRALDDVSFEVRKGDVFGIMGTNGSGKSTMLKIIAGVLEPTSGTCEINGKIAPLIELGAGFDMDLSARENIYLNGALLGYSKEFIDEKFDDIVEFAEIEKFLDMPLKNYSSGMVARIAFAIATVIIPEILLVDEVLSVGDFMFQKKCEDRITELIEEYGVTVLIVSHSNDQISRLCNRAIWIEKGHTRLIGEASLVSHVYGGLGGRVGSPESEQLVFDALKRCEKIEEDKNLYEVFSGDNPYSTSVELVVRVLEEKPVNTLALTVTNSHVNSIVASAYASLFHAPILPVDPNGLSDSLIRSFYELKPDRILLFDTGRFAENIVNEIADFDQSIEVVHLGKTGQDFFEFSLSLFEKGKKDWGDIAFLVDPKDNLQSFALSPYIYSEKAPVFLSDSSLEQMQRIADKLKGSSIRRIFLVGENRGKISKDVFRKSGIEASVIGVGDSLSSQCFHLFEETENQFGNRVEGKKNPLYISLLNISQWVTFAPCSFCCAENTSGLLLVDKTNLDSLAEALRYIRAHRQEISELIFVGNNHGLGPADFKIFLSALM